jgi:hypothetical protein
MKDTDNLVVLVDSIGRTVIGLENAKESTKAHLALVEPAVVFVQPNPDNGQIQVQVIPFFFKELMKGGADSEKVTWLFDRKNVTLNTGLDVDEKLSSQYDRIVNPSSIVAPDTGGIVTPKDAKDPEVVKLFDD